MVPDIPETVFVIGNVLARWGKLVPGGAGVEVRVAPLVLVQVAELAVPVHAPNAPAAEIKVRTAIRVIDEFLITFTVMPSEGVTVYYTLPARFGSDIVQRSANE
jgi:hypothetical protein